MKKVTVFLATAIISFLTVAFWLISEIVLAAKDDAFDFDVFDEDN